MVATTKKYNPGFLKDDELVESFCVRTAELESMIEMLHECDGSANPHRIVIGPRGSGKTSLLLRVAAEIRRDKDLSRRFFPVVFAEESYEVATTGEFWLECLSRLADQAPRREDAPDLRLTVEDLRPVRDDRALGDRCLGALLDFANREGQRLVLIVENLNMMFGDMADTDAGWRLRQTLQAEPRILVLASATSRFEEIDSPDRALYDLFRIVPLRPLDTKECAVLWERVSGHSRAPGTIKALRILTGGSPRLLAILARFGAGLSFRELLTELVDLVDDHTEYFKSHLETLPAQERRVYLALADLWKPATAREVADRARLDTSKCSAHLTRLIDRGVVEVAGGGARRKQYYLTERLYNIYYLMRRFRGPEPLIEALVRFMESYYSPSELKDIGVRLAQESDVDAEAESFRRPALMHLMESPMLTEYRDELLANIPGNLAKEFAPSLVLPNAVGAAAVGVALAFHETDHADESLETPEGLETALALFDEAVALDAENRSEDALAKCDEMIRRVEDSDAPIILELIASALVLKGDMLAGSHRMEDPRARFGEVVRELWTGGTLGLSEMISISLTGQRAGLNRASEALAAYDEVLCRFGKSDISTVLDGVARALIRKGITLFALDRAEEALAAIEEVIFRFGKADDASLLEVATKALVMKGSALLVLGRAEEASAALDEAVRGFRKGNTPDTAEGAGYACLFQGLVLVQLGRTEEALASWDAALGLFGDVETLLVPEMTAVIFNQKATTLAGLDRVEEALGAYDEALRRYEETESPVFSEMVATALVNRGNMLGRLNRTEEALAVYDEVIRRYGKDDAPALLELSANALFRKGDLLEKSDRQEEALTVFGDVVDRFNAGGAPGIQEPVARSLFQRAIILDRLSRPEDALSVLDEAAGRFGETDAPILLELAAKALLKKGMILRKLDRLEEAIVANDEVLRRFGELDVPDLPILILLALVGNGFALYELNRPAEALCVFDEAVQRVGKNDTPEAFGLFVFARVGQGIALRELDRPEEALYAFEEATTLFEESEYPWLRENTGPTLIEKAALEMSCERYAAAVATAGRALDRKLGPTMKNQLRGHLIRAKSAQAGGDSSLCKQDIEKVLLILPEFGSLPREALDVLMALSVELGPAEMHALIQASPSAALLLPLATALERELGLDPRVAREVEEVAQDIRDGLARMGQDAAMRSREVGD